MKHTPVINITNKSNLLQVFIKKKSKFLVNLPKVIAGIYVFITLFIFLKNLFNNIIGLPTIDISINELYIYVSLIVFLFNTIFFSIIYNIINKKHCLSIECKR